jgi:flavin reductase (DIM6/NTAB) family NADH-FMN oxidoreductase RutF
MSDSPKHPADPANELASGNSAIDPRDLRNALGTFATGVTIVSQGLTIFQNASHFTVNILGASQQALALQFAKSADDKFAGVDWTPGLGNAPVLANCVANFQCRAANRYYGGDHIIFLGAVEAYAYNRQEPLLFARGGFGGFAAVEAAKRS